MAGPGDDLRAAGKAIRDATKKSLRKGGNDLKRDLLQSVGAATGGDRVFSGAGGKLGVTLRVRQAGSTTLLALEPQKRTAAQWQWANTGTRGGARRARRGRSRYVMRHPGTSGRGAWDRVVDRDVPGLIDQLRNDIAGA